MRRLAVDLAQPPQISFLHHGHSSPMASAVRSTALPRHLQTGQDFHLLATIIEGCLLAHQSLHAPRAGRKIGLVDVELDIGGELSLMARGTEMRLGARSPT